MKSKLLIISISILMATGCTQSLMSKTYMKGGEFSERTGNYDVAYKRCRRAAQKQPDNPEPVMGMGRLLFKKDMFAKAEEAFSEAILRDNKNPDAYLWRARSYMELKNFDKALRDLDRAVAVKRVVKIVPQETMSRMSKDVEQEARKQNNLAAQSRLEAAEIYFLRGIASSQTGNKANAETYTDRAMELLNSAAELATETELKNKILQTKYSYESELNLRKINKSEK